jgi:hypothetical protein
MAKPLWQKQITVKEKSFFSRFVRSIAGKLSGRFHLFLTRWRNEKNLATNKHERARKNIK